MLVNKDNQKKIDKGRCHACGEKKTPEQLTINNGSVCQQGKVNGKKIYEN